MWQLIVLLQRSSQNEISTANRNTKYINSRKWVYLYLFLLYGYLKNGQVYVIPIVISFAYFHKILLCCHVLIHCYLKLLFFLSYFNLCVLNKIIIILFYFIYFKKIYFDCIWLYSEVSIC